VLNSISTAAYYDEFKNDVGAHALTCNARLRWPDAKLTVLFTHYDTASRHQMPESRLFICPDSYFLLDSVLNKCHA
jgi:hypothetical protein